jgi:hypothetical protein
MAQEDAERRALCRETIAGCEERIAAISRGEWDEKLARWGRSREEVIAVQRDAIQAVEIILADMRSGIPLIPCPEPECPHFVSQRIRACPWCSHPLSPSL